jgi:tryptophanyl-tRNA synthetase
MSKKILVSGVQPSGQLHVGNYFGALKQFVDLQDEYDAHIFVANYHAMTTTRDAQELAQQTLDVAIDLLAIGLDPKKVTLYLQTAIPEVTELTWIFNTLVSVPYLQRAHAYKDKTAKGLEANVGLFDYPVLMAADILLPNADVVPVGQDQKQHVEYARDIAEKFNATYGDTFTVPKALILENVATVPGTDGQKMSKSYGNTIPLFALRDEIEKAVMSIPTDSQPIDAKKDPEKDLVFQFHTLFAGDALPEIERGYREGGLGYADSKKMLIEEIDSFIAPLREKRAQIATDLDTVKQILADGGAQMHKKAQERMAQIRKIVGLL